MYDKYTYEYVKNDLFNYGYTLISEYINNCIKITIKDNDGYMYTVSYANFRQGKRPKIVSPSNLYSIQNIKLWMKLNDINDYDLISTEYKKSNEILFFKTKEGYICSSTWSNFSRYNKPSMVEKSNPYTIQNIQQYLDLNLKGYKLLSTEYKSNNSKLKLKCNNGHIIYKTWSDIKLTKCPICSNKQVLKGYNDIATTDPWMIDLGMSREDAETHTKGSNDKITVTCPHCGKITTKKISNISTYKTINCTCGDGYSYPEKFIMELLNQLDINYISQLSKTIYKWCDKYKYDFYLPDYNCIIETHGEQHYKQSTRGRSLEEEQQNDRYKKELAEQNGIDNYIVLDCRISTLEQIKNSVLNSELNNMFDLSVVDWLKCEKYITSNKIKEICDYWHLHNDVNNEELTTTDISNIVGLERSTIINYLKKGTKLGWCNYNGNNERKKQGIKNGKANGKKVEIFKDEKSLGIFPSCCELERQSEELFGVKLLNNMISKVCNNKIKQYKGFTFKYVKEMI